MVYHIDTGLIYEKFKTPCNCPLCEIEKKAEEIFVNEFLNDAVMEDKTRTQVNKTGFCQTHFDMLFNRQNKLSLALQVYTRVNTVLNDLSTPKSFNDAKKQADFLDKSHHTCIICNLLEESMQKYYKTIAQMFQNEEDFYKTLLATKGFCLKHYAQLLRYSKYAGKFTKEYLYALDNVEKRSFNILQEDMKDFCDKHDYRNAMKPLGSAETALPRMRVRLYGEEKK